MTEDELDLIASAYLDGEATPEEVALVERDPELAARVEELRGISRAVSTPVQPPAPSMVEQQLSAALAELDAPISSVPTIETEGSEIVDLRERASRPRKAGSRRTTERTSRRTSMPTWLPAAAAVILLGGGVIWLANQTGSDSLDTASDAIGAEETEAGSADFDDASGGDDAEGSADATVARAAEAEAVMDEAGDASADDAAAAPADGGSDESAEEDSEPSTTTTGGFFGNEPVQEFAEVPEPETIMRELPAPRTDLESSVCAFSVELPAGSELAGFLPIAIDGQPAEVIVTDDGGGARTILIVADDCTVLAP